MKVLVVDDNQNARESTIDRLKSTGIEAEGASTAEEARKWLEQRTEPVLLVLDHDLGGDENGFDVACWAREHHPWGLVLPIIYLTGFASEHDFILEMRKDGRAHLVPSAFVTKDEQQQKPELLPQLVQKFESQFERLHQIQRDQVLRRAIVALSSNDEPEA